MKSHSLKCWILQESGSSEDPSNATHLANEERISDGEFDEDDGTHYHSAPSKSTVSTCYMWWAIVSTTLLIAVISIAIFAHPRKRSKSYHAFIIMIFI